MNDMRNAYAEFWSGFLDRSGLPHKPIPAWQEGYVPHRHKDAWPRITYQIALPAFMGSAILAASIWDRRTAEIGYFGLVDDVLEQAREKISESGELLIWGGGALWIMRSEPFIDYLDDPDDQAVTRGIIRTVVRSHVL